MKISMTCGVFDMFHKGHKELFEMMRGNEGSRTFVFLHDDKSTFENKEKFPVQNIEHRKDNLFHSGLVDNVFVVHNANPGNDFNKFLSQHKGDDITYYRGNDWQDFPGKDVLEKFGVPIVMKEYTEGISSTKIRSEL